MTDEVNPGLGDTGGRSKLGPVVPGPGAQRPDEAGEQSLPATKRLARRGPLWRLIDFLVLVCVTGMVVTVALQVVSRSMGASLAWTEELTRILFIYATFLGLAAGFRQAEHARIAFVVQKLPRMVQKMTVHLYVATTLVFFAIVAFQGWGLVRQQFRSEETSPALGLGMYLVTLPIVLSAALCVVAVVQCAYRSPELREALERGEMTSV